MFSLDMHEVRQSLSRFPSGDFDEIYATVFIDVLPLRIADVDDRQGSGIDDFAQAGPANENVKTLVRLWRLTD
jgi:hypothetical protein